VTQLDFGLEEIGVSSSGDARARLPSTSTFTVPSGSFSSCSTVPACRPDRRWHRPRRIVLAGVLLGDEQDLLVVLHHLFERA
jgi:hypothetical protein